jgi:hypothetical protein
MGVFSWNTSDTKESIPASRNLEGRLVFTVYMLAPDGRVWEEDDYEGYGMFGGKDYYELMAEINGQKSDRSNGIDLEYGKDQNILRPRLVRNPELKYADVPDPTQCKFQGYFYYDEEEDEQS